MRALRHRHGFRLSRSYTSLQSLYNRRRADEGLLSDPCQLELLEKLDGVVQQLVSKKASQGLYIYGGVGTGKTMMLDMFHEAVTSGGVSSDRQHFHGLCKAVDMSYHKMMYGGKAPPKANAWSYCAQEYRERYQVLAFDEAHVLNIGDAMRIKIFMEEYFRAGGVVVATSNVAPDDLYASGVNRETFLPFIETLRKNCEFYQMQSREDYRARNSDDARTRGGFLWGEVPEELTPHSFPALEQPDELPEAKPYTFPVGFGRSMTCNHTWNLGTESAPKIVARFTFDELCRASTGPTEWLGLAEHAAAVLVSDVPRFEAHDEDAARRFITFVDVAYDQKRFLGITAEAGPDAIFEEFIAKYGGELQPEATSAKAEREEGRIKMPAHGLASGRHGVIFQRPKSLKYTQTGAYVTTPEPQQGPAESGEEWVEWSATGLKDASLFDLSPTGTSTQVRDKLLPFIRCSSRLTQMAKAAS
ncbi:unnamed protein product [Effrenium voratum]|nr:unnamed protein product [Effrenium voratum]